MYASNRGGMAMERINHQHRPIPAHPTTEEYLAEKKQICKNCTALLVFAAVLMGPILVVTLLLWAADFFASCVTCMIALLIIGIPTLILLGSITQEIVAEGTRMGQLKKNYKNSVQEEHME